MAEHLWERQQGESAKAFDAFECYRTLGPDRSLQARLGEALHATGDAAGEDGEGTERGRRGGGLLPSLVQALAVG